MYFLLESNIRLKTVYDIELDYNGHIIYIQSVIKSYSTFTVSTLFTC